MELHSVKLIDGQIVEKMARKYKCPVGSSCHMDETYINVNGAWKQPYLAVGKQDKTVNLLLTAKRHMATAKRFFDMAMGLVSGMPVSRKTLSG